MHGLLHAELPHLLHLYGYSIVALIVALEGMGLPLPGETTLVAAALYAGSTRDLSIGFIILAAFMGAVTGDNAGFWIGRGIGLRLALRYGSYIWLTERRIKLGQFLFRRHGGKLVFFARFVALLRALGAFLAGMNQMPWRRFAIFNAGGGAVWATLYGLAAYLVGDELERLSGPIATVTSLAALAAVAGGLLFLHRHEQRLADEAERQLPGPIRRSAPLW
ncbi:DedA family protein [Reyranella sp.]|jgi:membrane protein DedA with SNARE-associated domain|uniref:DedA family protein n=1 Tax=Reyranella sp. TaxID=1929291 RepID=UPI002F926D74